MPMIEQVGTIPSEKYSEGSEILEHLLKIAHRYDLYRNACLQTGVTGMRWDETQSLWHISTDRDDDIAARSVVLSNGLLVKPKLTGISGIETFKGHTLHTRSKRRRVGKEV